MDGYRSGGTVTNKAVEAQYNVDCVMAQNKNNCGGILMGMGVVAAV